jgi:predicted metalloprotease
MNSANAHLAIRLRGGKRLLLALALAAASSLLLSGAGAALGASSRYTGPSSLLSASAKQPPRGNKALGALAKAVPATRKTKITRVAGAKLTPSDRPAPRIFSKYNLTLGQFLDWAASSVNSFWAKRFARLGWAYSAPWYAIVDTNTSLSSACDAAVSPGGSPFYCGGDYPCTTIGVRRCGEVYLTADYYYSRVLQTYGAFAVGVSVAHEWGHHIQDLLNYFPAVQQGRLKSIHLELQADCFAGVWANSIYYQGLLEAGDIEAALNARYAIGDNLPWDYPGAHGSPQQRREWFRFGYNTGDPSRCKTF